MSLSTATVTFDLSDMLGVDFDARRTKVWIDTNIADDTIIDTSTGAIRLGSGNVTLETDGTGEFTTWIPGVDANPETWQTSVHVDYPDRNNSRGGRSARTFGPFTIAANIVVSNKALTSNVATLTTSTAHGFDVGDKVTVADVGAPFDGAFTIASVPTTTTLTFAVTSANVASVAAAGHLLHDLGKMVEEQEIPPEYLTTVTELLDGYADSASASATSSAASATSAAASAVLADSYIVADLNTSDGQMEALIESPSSLTALALSATYVPSEDVVQTTLESTIPADAGKRALTVGNTHTSFSFTPDHGNGIYGPFVLYERFGIDDPGDPVPGTTQAGYVVASYFGPTADDSMEGFSVFATAADSGVGAYTQSKPITAFEAQATVSGDNDADFDGHLRASCARVNVRDTATANRATAFYAGAVTIDAGATLATYTAFEQASSPTVSGVKYGVKVIDPVHTETELRLVKTGVTAGVRFAVAGSGGSSPSLAAIFMPNVTGGETDLSGIRIQQGPGGLKNLQEWWLTGGTIPAARVTRLGGFLVAGGAGGIKYTNAAETVTYMTIDNNGLNWGTATLEQLSVGAAGAGAALPATPTKYLRVKDSAGTTLVIPAYAAS